MRDLRRFLCLCLALCLCLSVCLLAAATDSGETNPPASSSEPTEPPAPSTQAPTEPPAPSTQAPTEPPAPSTEAPTEPPEPSIEPPAPSIVLPTQPPAPSTEAPTEPAPTPTQPQPTAPTPTQPQPTAPTPTQPSPTYPQPTNPQPTNPQPTNPPAPTEPTQPPEVWPWENSGKPKQVLRWGGVQPAGVPDDTNIESRDEDGKLCYTIPETWTAQDVINWFVKTYALTPDTFAVSYECPSTGARASYNENTWMLAAGTYMLPLNLYYYEEQAAGVYTDDTLIDGIPLKEAHAKSILDSDSAVSEAMIREFGSYRAFKQEMLDRYGDPVRGKWIPPEYDTDNYYSAPFMLGVLRSLYARADQFPELLNLLKQTTPDRYLRHYAGETPVAHKYGTFEGEHHDVGIVYAEQPFLLAVFTRDVIGMASGEDLIGRICLAMMTWQEQAQHTAPDPTDVPDTTDAPDTNPETEPASGTAAQPAESTDPATPPMQPAQRKTPWYFIAFPIIILLGTVATAIVFRKRL